MKTKVRKALQTQKELEAKKGQVKVVNGVNTMDGEFAGWSLATLRSRITGPFNIAPEAGVLVNGVDPGADYIIKKKDVIEFVKPSGEKGLE